MSKVKIGIIGRGFVGSAVANGFSSNTGFASDLKIYDKPDQIEKTARCLLYKSLRREK